MKSLGAFIKKEWLDIVRSGRLLVLVLIYLMLGIMNPAIAKLTPWLMEMTAESLKDSGLIVTTVTVDAMTSWTQFVKNAPMGLIAFILISSNLFTKEYDTGSLILVLTKGLARYKVVLAKWILLVLTWTICYFIYWGITYGYNAYFWDNSVAQNLMEVAMCWWLLGIFAIAFLVLFSTLFKNSAMVLLGTGGIFLLSYIMGMIPKLADYMPTTLMNTTSLLTGVEEVEIYTAAFIITAILGVLGMIISIPILNKKKL